MRSKDFIMLAALGVGAYLIFSKARTASQPSNDLVGAVSGGISDFYSGITSPIQSAANGLNTSLGILGQVISKPFIPQTTILPKPTETPLPTVIPQPTGSYFNTPQFFNSPFGQTALRTGTTSDRFGNPLSVAPGYAYNPITGETVRANTPAVSTSSTKKPTIFDNVLTRSGF